MHEKTEVRPINLSFVDLETSGLDPEKHDVVEAAAVRVSVIPGPDWESSWKVEKTLDVKVMPGHMYMEPFVARINGFSAEAWKDAVPLPEMLTAMYEIIDTSIVFGSKPDFDHSFLKAGFDALGWNFPRVISNHRIDVPTFAIGLLLAGKIQRIKQHDVAKYFGLPDQEHRAMADVLQCIEIFKRFHFRSFL